MYKKVLITGGAGFIGSHLTDQSNGGATFRNSDGSFFHFEAYKFHQKPQKELLTSQTPDDWGGRVAINWARQLGKGEGFNKEAY